MPGVNPVDSSLAIHPLAAGFVGKSDLTLTHAYRWDGWGTAVSPGAGQFGGELALALRVTPNAPAAGYRANDLLDLFTLEPETGLTLRRPLTALSDLPLPLDVAAAPLTHTQRVTLTLQYENVGTAVVPDARVQLHDDPRLRFFASEIRLGDVTAGQSGEVQIPAIAIADPSATGMAQPQLAVWDSVYGVADWFWAQFPVQARPNDTTPPTVELAASLQTGLANGELSPGQFTWTGSTQDNAEVGTVEICVMGGCETVTAVPDVPGTAGDWTYTLPLPDTEGVDYEVTVTAVDAAGNRSEPLNLPFTVYNGPPDLTITAPAAALLADYYAPNAQTPPLLHGQIAAGGQLAGVYVFVQREGEAGRWLRAAVNGRAWSLTPALPAAGRYRFLAQSRDANGRVKAFGPVFVDVQTNQTVINTRPYPSTSVPGAFIELQIAALPGGWTQVEWQTAAGDWISVSGWQGTPDVNGRVLWYAGPELLGTGPYRWLVFEGKGERPWAVSAPFTVPDRPGWQRQITVYGENRTFRPETPTRPR